MVLDVEDGISLIWHLLACRETVKEGNKHHFNEEYQSLYAISRVHHPNIVTFLGSFLYGDDDTISRNFQISDGHRRSEAGSV